MARDRSPKCKQCRREGIKLFLKGERCLTEKLRDRAPAATHRESMVAAGLSSPNISSSCARSRRHGGTTASSRSSSGSITSGRRASRASPVRRCCGCSSCGSTASSTGSASRRPGPRRAIIRHGHFQVNGRRVNIPSFQVEPGDIVSMKAESPVEQIVRDATDLTASVPPWLQADHDNLTGKVLKAPERARSTLLCRSSSSWAVLQIDGRAGFPASQ